MNRFLSLLIYGLSAGLGIIAFVSPFWLTTVRQSAAGASQGHSLDAPLTLTALVGLCLAALLLEAQSQVVGAKLIAMLGVLTAINAVLRFVETAVLGLGGFSPVFFLIVVTGYVFGSRLGFLMGALSLFVSALITGGAGPWLPYQMFTAGWVGMAAPLCRPPVWLLKGRGKWAEVIVLALLGGLAGLIYGAVMNIWFWPFATGAVEQTWSPGISPADTLKRYALFYVTTSLWWDAMRSLGNIGLTLALGRPTLRVLRRFQKRFTFEYRPAAQTPVISPGPARVGEPAEVFSLGQPRGVLPGPPPSAGESAAVFSRGGQDYP
jgi:energy-coupling factor transport system substrate-specific component